MAEKSTRIANATSGDYIATRDGYEQDASSNDRTIQLVDQAVRHHGFELSTPTRSVDGNDSTDFTSGIPADIVNNALNVGDKSTLVVAVKYKVSDVTPANKVVITPLVLDSNNNCIGFLEPKLFQNFHASAAFFSEGSGSDLVNYSMIQMWDVKGASKIGIHVQFTSTDGATKHADVWAAVISGDPDSQIASDPDAAGTWGSEPAVEF